MSLNKFKGKKVLITGGLGFIGSNLAHALVNLGAEVEIIDSLNPLHGGNLYNIEEIKDIVKLHIADIRDRDVVNQLVVDKDYIFSFAAQVSYTDSDKDSLGDVDINCRGHLNILEACKEHNKNVKIIFSSSRMVIGKPMADPIDEEHPTNPLGIYGIHKLTAEKYYLNYFKNYGIRSVVMRLTNPYGERQQIRHSKYGIVAWFVRLAMEGKPIKIFGDGAQLRDYVYVDDLINALLNVSALSVSDGQIYNCGLGKSRSLREMAELVIKEVGNGSIEYISWPENYKNVETGNSEVSIEKISKDTNWAPKYELEEGLKKMVAYYKEKFDKYL